MMNFLDIESFHLTRLLKPVSRYNNEDYVYPFIVQIGAGGTGGYLVQHIAQLLGTNNIPATYIVADPDVIEEKNLGNQLYLAEEVGLKKADVLADRYSAAYGINIFSQSESYVESIEDIKELFVAEYMKSPYPSYKTKLIPILIGAVDNHYTRKIMHEFFQHTNPCIYIDAGNESTIVPVDWQTRPKEEWTNEEKEEFESSGWTGQVVTGMKMSNYYQAPLAVAFPDVLEDTDELRPSELSCSELAASEPQRLIVNKFAAMAIMSSLSQVLEQNEITTHVTHFHARRGYMNSVPVQITEY